MNETEAAGGHAGQPGAPGRSPLAAAARRLLVLRIVEIVLYVAGSLLFALVSSADLLPVADSVAHVVRAYSALWLLLEAIGLGLLVPFARSLATTPSARLARAALTLAAICFLWSALQGFEDLTGTDILPASGTVAGHLTLVSIIGLHASLDVCFWLAATRVASRVPSSLGPAYFSLLALRVAISLLLALMPLDIASRLYASSVLSLGLTLFRIGTNVAGSLLVVLVLWRLVQHGAAAAAGPPADPVTAVDGTRDLVVGGLWLGAGLLVTVASYAAAGPGSHFVVTTGAIVYGLVRIGRGLVRGSHGPSPP